MKLNSLEQNDAAPIHKSMDTTQFLAQYWALALVGLDMLLTGSDVTKATLNFLKHTAKGQNGHFAANAFNWANDSCMGFNLSDGTALGLEVMGNGNAVQIIIYDARTEAVNEAFDGPEALYYRNALDKMLSEAWAQMIAEDNIRAARLNGRYNDTTGAY